jgi:DNA-binding CsgD family transcriptional regulator
MLDALSSTIEKIYSAASGSVEWKEALLAIEELTGSAGAVINLVDKQDPPASTMIASSGIEEHFDAASLDEYNRDLLSICPRVAAGVANPDLSIVFDYLILSEAEMDKDPVYDWYRRHGLRYFIGSPLGETSRLRLMWSLQRTPAQGHVQEADKDRFKVLKPHVERALALAEQIGTLRSYQRFSSAMIEALPQAVFALDKQGRLLFANGAGNTVLKAGDGLSDIAGHLRTSCPADQDCLDALVKDAVNPSGSVTSAWMRISRPSGKLPYAVFVSPLVGTAEDPMSQGASVLLVVHDTGARQTVDPDMLKSVYALTETETRLAAALAQGHSVESASATLLMRPATARTHLKSVFRKLGVHRQQDLTRLLAFLSTLRPGE